MVFLILLNWLFAIEKFSGLPKNGVGSYLLLSTLFHRLYSVVLPTVFCAKSIVIFVRSIVLLANPEARSMRYDTTRKMIF